MSGLVVVPGQGHDVEVLFQLFPGCQVLLDRGPWPVPGIALGRGRHQHPPGEADRGVRTCASAGGVVGAYSPVSASECLGRSSQEVPGAPSAMAMV